MVLFFLYLREFCKNAKGMPVMWHVARNGCAQRVYWVDGIENNVQPIEERRTGRFKRYSWSRTWSTSSSKISKINRISLIFIVFLWFSLSFIDFQWFLLIFTRFLSILWSLPTSRVSFEAPSATFFDRLDIFFDAIDLINTLGTSIPRHRWHNWHTFGILAEFSQVQKNNTRKAD